MKAIVCYKYGSPGVLRCEETGKPTAGNNEVLIKVRAASVNPLDWHLKRGAPYITRLITGLRKPRDTRLGVDVAGQVEAVGWNVTEFKPGDEVFGSCRGAFAEYVCASESALVTKPDNRTFEQAASVPAAAFTALQGLRDKGKIQPGQEVQRMNVNHSGQNRNARQHLMMMLAVVAFQPFAARLVAQERIDPMAATVAPFFAMIQQSFVSLADAMPAENYGFKPPNGEFKESRTFGEQVKHVACANFGFFNEIEKKEPPPDCAAGGPSPARTKAELVKYLRESFDYAQSVLRTMTAANALEPAGGPYGGSSTRLGLTTLAIWHASDHYGQLVVYLRMNGVVPPASRPAR